MAELSPGEMADISRRSQWSLTMTSPDMGGVSSWAFNFFEIDGRRSPGLGVNGFRGSDEKVQRVARAPEDIKRLIVEVARLQKENESLERQLAEAKEEVRCLRAGGEY